MAISISIGLSESNVSVANNTSYVTATVYYTTTNQTYNNNKKPGTIYISGSSYSFSASFAKQQSGKYLASAGKTITHNSDGSGSASASATFTSGTNSGTVSTGTRSITLTTIPRASTMSCPATFTAGTAGTITLSRKSSGFTHTASCSLGNTGLSATSGIATSFTYTPPIDLFNSSTYANTKSRTGSITVQTKSGSTSIGGALTQNITVNLPENATTKPTCTLSSSIAEVGSSFASRYGVLIAGKSKLQFSCSSSAKLSATVADHYFEIPGSSATRSDSDVVTTGYLTTSSSEAMFSYYVKDSRGFTSEKQTLQNPYKVVEYTKPGIAKLTAVRCNANGVEDPVNGTRIKFKVDYYVDPIVLSGSEKTPNAATIKIYKLTKDSDGNITGRTLLKDASGSMLTVSNTGEYTALTGTEFPVTNSYFYEATIVDELTTTEQSLGNGTRSSVNTAKAMLSFYAGEGVAMGKIAERSGLDIAFNTTIKDIDFTIEVDEYDGLLNSLGDSSVEFTPLTLVNIIHPIGSVIANADANFDPNVHFGGTTWERYAEGRMLIGLSTGDAAFQTIGSEGGEKAHTLTAAEMPAHTGHGSPWSGNYAAYVAQGVATKYGSSGRGWSVQAGNELIPTYVSAGGDAPHNNLPPYKVVNYWIRTA